MAEPGLQVSGIPAPPPLPAQQGQQDPQQQAQLVEQPQQQAIHMNWSHFKPEFLEKPEEDAEAYLHSSSHY